MSEDSELKKVKRWQARIGQANKAYNAWSDDFRVQRCKRYWRGFQRVAEDRFDSKGNERLQVNLILPTVGIKIPTLYFYYPYAKVTGSPQRSDTPAQKLDDRAQLLQDTANTIIREQTTNFRFETLIALKDAFWAFGIVEIGHSADFVDNPAFKRPALAEDETAKDEMGGGKRGDADDGVPEPSSEDDGSEAISGLKQLVDKEAFYVRRIPPESFRCSVNAKPTLLQNDWIGYYEWMQVEDVKASKAYKNTKNLKASGKIAKDYQIGDDITVSASASYQSRDADVSASEAPERSGMVKVWKLWNLREKKRYALAEGHNKFLLEKTYKVLPLYLLRFEIQPDDLYPIPPITAMLSPQDEYNDSREMLRILRKSIYPRSLIKDGAIEDSELEKLEEGGPGVYAKCQDPASAIVPVQQPSYDSNIVRTLVVSKQDLSEVSTTGGEARGRAESETATQASIIDRRSVVRESFGRMQVAEWLAQIISGLIRLAIDEMTLPMWILRNVDPFSPNLAEEAKSIADRYREITFEELQDADSVLRWDVSVDVETLSPITEEGEQSRWAKLISMLAAPAVAMLLSRSPTLLKKVLDSFGLRSSQDQDAIRQALGMVSDANILQGGGVPNPPQMQQPGGGPAFASKPAGPGAPSPEPGMGGPAPSQGPAQGAGAPPPTAPGVQPQ